MACHVRKLLTSPEGSHHFPHSFPEMPPLWAIPSGERLHFAMERSTHFLMGKSTNRLVRDDAGGSHTAMALKSLLILAQLGLGASLAPGHWVGKDGIILPVVFMWVLHGMMTYRIFLPVKIWEDFPIKSWRVFMKVSPGQDKTDHANKRGSNQRKVGEKKTANNRDFPGKYGDCSCKKNRDSGRAKLQFSEISTTRIGVELLTHAGFNQQTSVVGGMDQTWWFLGVYLAGHLQLSQKLLANWVVSTPRFSRTPS